MNAEARSVQGGQRIADGSRSQFDHRRSSFRSGCYGRREAGAGLVEGQSKSHHKEGRQGIAGITQGKADHGYLSFLLDLK